MTSTYFGKQGYTIYKECLEPSDLKFIRETLTVAPYIPKSPVQPEPFSIYKEGHSKIYLPRHFGVEHFGDPDEVRIPQGDDISVKFSGSLRTYQVEIVDAFFKSVAAGKGGGLLDIPCGFGKCHGKDTKIMMYDGSIKLVQDVKVGDQLMGDDSKPRNVLSLARGREKLYKVTPTKGDSYIVNESHILSLKCSTDHSKSLKKDTVIDMSVKEWLNLPNSYHGRAGVLYGYRVPIEFAYAHVDLDPYFLGLWLGDGNSRMPSITTIDKEIEEYLTMFARENNVNIRRHDKNEIGWALVTARGKPNPVLQSLQRLNLIANKHIPKEYKCNSRDVQLRVLAGIIDSDGSLGVKGYDVIQKNERLLDDIIFIARSIGFSAYKKECTKYCVYKGEKREGTYYRTNIHGPGVEEIPVKVLRKICNEERMQCKDVLLTRIKVTEYEEEGDYYGFTLDGNHRYLLGDFQVTHNTAMGIYIACKLKKKCLVIVHKGFLLNQWIERIEEFAPGARIGKIQGQVIDIDDKDIVIGMLQSLSMKEYPSTMFDSFGLTIVDECHHISSEVFSRSLTKIVTPYTLGLSATMDRKDGLTHVFKMFLGDIVYAMKRESEDNVLVKAITYESNDAEFEEVVYDYRGNPQYSTMITKLCDYNHRTEFILKVIKKEMDDYPNQQIMILGQNKSILKYVYDAISHRKMFTVGYYIGGMKKKDLADSEIKQVIVATYAMAAEGLDIKSLTTLMLVTPRTDITQAVGRILRVKRERPLVIDIVDTHDVFNRQFKKRAAFYKKNNYTIMTTDSNRYIKDEWEEMKKRGGKSKKKTDDLLDVGKCMLSL